MNTFSLNTEAIAAAGATLIAQCHGNALASGWHHKKDGSRKEHNRAERLCLIHSEISEAMEGHRKSLMDDHLPQYPMHATELADAVIRIMDEAGDCGYQLGEIIAAKLAYNAVRPDHKPEAREAAGGKAY